MLNNKKLKNTLSHMKYRCCNKNDKGYRYYGGRGITICQEWLNDSTNFYKWSIENGYKENLTIDRIDNDGNYEPSNCRWVSMSVQASNRNKSINNKSGYIGIHKTKRGDWIGKIVLNGKVIFKKRNKNINTILKRRDNFIIENNLPHKLNLK